MSVCLYYIYISGKIDFVIANYVLCMAYTRKVVGGSYTLDPRSLAQAPPPSDQSLLLCARVLFVH